MRIEAFGLTETGRQRPYNEDDFLCLDLSPHERDGSPPFFLLAAADGIGGHAGGQVASAMAVDVLRRLVQEQFTEQKTDIEWRRLMAQTYQAANRAIFGKAAGNEGLRGMGTTLVTALIRGERVLAANIGDSRLYLVRNGSLEQITLDHSWRAEQLRRNQLSSGEIERSPFRNMITRSLGYAEEVEVDLFHFELRGEGFILLCTDGLYGLVSDEQIQREFKKKRTPQEICRRLVRRANRAGGTDNITAIVARFEREGLKSRRASPADTVKLEPRSGI